LLRVSVSSAKTLQQVSVMKYLKGNIKSLACARVAKTRYLVMSEPVCIQCKGNNFKEVESYQDKTYKGIRIMQCQTCGRAFLALSTRDHSIVEWLTPEDEKPRKNYV
jgi:hypothetical protein